MQNKKFKSVLRIFLPALLILFFVFTTAFPHVHIMDNVAIVHSHPYKKDCNGNPTHTHTWSQIYLIQALSNYQITTVIIFFVLLGITLLKYTIVFTPVYRFFQQKNNTDLYRLRPPPISL